MKTKFKLSLEQKQFFLQEIKKIIYTENFLKLKNYFHHGHITTYSHSIKVAYYSYKYAKKYHIKVNGQELIRSALLHDLYFYDWHDRNNGIHLHGLFHPKTAVLNAQKHYKITANERKHMIHHMFPLTLLPPATKIGWIICYCDKKATLSDYKALQLRKKALKKLKH